jgi:acyl-[acyl-carrier-protein]-phospholipid O-acyltransferase/long-chain-fatty-acid--[acyl-carrier-protein] ligase
MDSASPRGPLAEAVSMTTSPTVPRRPLAGLLAAQALGAFNDNAWKMVVTLLLIGALPRDQGFEAASQSTTTLAFVVFTLPLVLFSVPGGMLADRFSKRSVIVALKALEVVFMAAGTLALWWSPTGGTAALVVLGLMGLQSALFSPAKYGVLPELLPHERLAAGNGALEMWTFLAIVGGTAAGGQILDLWRGQPWLTGVLLTVLAVVGLCAACFVPRTPAPVATAERVNTFGLAWRAMRRDRVLGLAVAGAAFFWCLASLLGQDVLVYAKTQLGLGDSDAGLPLAVFGIGAGVGGVLAGRLSHHKVELGLIPLGAVLLGGLALTLGLLTPGKAGTLVLMALMGIASGLVIVPLEACLQWRAPERARGATIALANMFIFSGVIVGSLLAEGMSRVGLSASAILLGAAVVTLIGTAWALWLLPVALLRLVLVLLTHTLYRLKVVGRVHVPERGGALLVPNHVSFVDGLFLVASIDRPVRFVVDEGWFARPWLRPFMLAIDAIPISADGGPRKVLRALRDAGEGIERGELVCIFAEGQITRTGALLPFRRGLERIVKGRKAPIIPVWLDQVWGSIFSRAGGRFLFKRPERIPYPVTVAFGAPLPSGTPIHEVRAKVQELGCDSWILRKADTRPLHHGFVQSARRRPLGFAFADQNTPPLRWLHALAGAVGMARALRPAWDGQERVGVCLPPSVGGALVNLAASLAGRTVVNLNYTAGAAGIESAVRQAGLRTVVSHRVFLEKAGVVLPAEVKVLWIDEVSAGIGRGARIAALLRALSLPIAMLERACGAPRGVKVDDLATVIFSSGSTGEPKGVMLTHFNVGTNQSGVFQVLPLRPQDKLLGVLPLFHSFGYLALWLCAARGIGCVFHPNPLDALAIGELVQRHAVTLMIATPTFLQIYQRRVSPGQFGSVRLVVAGAEKLPERVAQGFQDTFGMRPLEGYGTTECAPVVSVSTLDFRAQGLFQAGSRRGSVGQALPGVMLRVVDPDSHAPLPPGTPGLLLVRGPNVMQGYLGQAERTAQVLRGGWYVTGDIACVDDDGFLRITDRLSRFSKIGGEMVPHARIEEALHEAAGVTMPTFAVTALPDERKGEQLVVVHCFAEDRIEETLARLGTMGLPNLFLPRRDRFVHVESLPMLGSGKLDLRTVKRVATEAFANVR